MRSPISSAGRPPHAGFAWMTISRVVAPGWVVSTGHCVITWLASRAARCG